MNEMNLYRDSRNDAKEQGQLDWWLDSLKANILCREAIENAVLCNFNGMHLNESCVWPVIEEYGHHRVAWVLSNTVQELNYDGRFSDNNKEWATQFRIPTDERNREFCVRSHPAVLDGFIQLYRKAYEELGLFTSDHCEPESFSSLNYEGKVLVLAPDTLNSAHLSAQNQLWLAHDGFGCRPKAIGRSVRCTCLSDGEHTRWNRADFIGVLKAEHLPEWAAKKLKELQPVQKPTFGGMEMK